MNVLCMATEDHGGQMYAISEALKKHTEHRAHCVTEYDTYHQHLHDTPSLSNPDLIPNLAQFLKDTEFFIFQNGIPWQALKTLKLDDRVNPNTTLIQLTRPVDPNAAPTLLMEWIQKGYLYFGPPNIAHNFNAIGRVAPISNILPIPRMPLPLHSQSKLRIFFAPTGNTTINNAWPSIQELLQRRYDNLEFISTEKASWNLTMQIKANCHITVNVLNMHTYSHSAIESMYLKHAVLGNIDRWTRYCFPDLPIVQAPNAQSILTELSVYAENPEFITDIGEKAHQFVLAHHSPELIASQISHLINHTATHQEYLCTPFVTRAIDARFFEQTEVPTVR